MSVPFFSYCTRVVGKDKTQVPRKDGNGTQERWTMFRNRFVNHSTTTLSEDATGNIVLRPVNRADVIKLIAHHGYATAYILKDETLKQARSQAGNILGARHMMVDFDNTMSLEQAMAHPWWSKVWFAYTTPSFGNIQGPVPEKERIKLPDVQLAEIDAQVGQPKRNFRLVLKFSRFVHAHEIAEIGAGFMSVFPMADQSCIDTARCMFGSVKARVEMPEHEYELTEQDFKELKTLGAQWREDHKKEIRQKLATVSSTAKDASGEFTGETLITLASGETLTVRDIMEQKALGFHEACYSPFRPENSPSAFVNKRADSGNVFVYDSGSGMKHTWKANDMPSTLKLFTKVKPEVLTELQPTPLAEALEQVTLVTLQRPARGPAYEPMYAQNLSLEDRRAQIKLAAGSLAPFNIFFAPEGFGKSFITAALSSRHRKIFFCCATNEQAVEKAEEFKKLTNNQAGFPMLIRPKIQLCVSRDYLFKESTDISVVKVDAVDPFGAPETDKWKTIEKIGEAMNLKVDDATEVWKSHYEQADVESPNFSEEGGFNIIVTTMARAEILAKVGAYRAMSEEWVVIYDDPGHADVSNLIPMTDSREARILEANERLVKAGKPEIVITRRTFSGRNYYVRPVDSRLGQNFKPFRPDPELDKTITIPVMFTTTEELTRFMIESIAPKIKLFDFMHETASTNVTIWGTSNVHAKSDGLIILATELLQYDYPEEPISLIADGLGQKLNHVNNKGNNNLSTQHIVIELSQLHPAKRTQLVDEITYLTNGKNSFTERDVQTFYMRDQMHQAIGRNSGYRERDGNYQTVVLCDPHYFDSLRDTCRYMPAPWSCQLDISEGDSKRQLVRKKKRGIETINFHGSMPEMLKTFQSYVIHPELIFSHKNLTPVVQSLQNPKAKARVVEAVKTQIMKNTEQNELLNRLIQVLV